MNKKVLKICSIIMALSLIALTFAACGKKEYTKTDATTTPGQTEASTTGTATPININPLTGLADLSDSAIGARPVAIMVENSAAARPQWGLSSPDIVLEGVVEGGITRMMWIYADVTKVPKIGPVRSARHDYVEIAQGMDAIYGHWGGSDQGYQTINDLKVNDLDGMSFGNKYFFKDSSRTSRGTEHAGYTNGEYLAKAIAEKGYRTQSKNNTWMPFTVITDGKRAPFGDNSGACSSITVEFSSGFKHTFKYNNTDKLYYNYMNSAEMKDGNNNQTMAVTNVIVMYCGTKTINSVGVQDWDLTSGDAVYVSYGYGESITWKKESKTAPLKFYGKDGKELTVNTGKTWIGVVPDTNRTKTTITE